MKKGIKKWSNEKNKIANRREKEQWDTKIEWKKREYPEKRSRHEQRKRTDNEREGFVAISFDHSPLLVRKCHHDRSLCLPLVWFLFVPHSSLVDPSSHLLSTLWFSTLSISSCPLPLREQSPRLSANLLDPRACLRAECDRRRRRRARARCNTGRDLDPGGRPAC